MNQPAIHLEEYHLEKLLIERREPEDPKGETCVAFAFDYKVQRNTIDPNFFRLTLIVRDNPEAKTPCPQIYKLDLQIHGIFRFKEGLEDEQMQYLIRVNGGTILYGVLRGILGTISGAFPERRINLPTIMMEDIVRQVEKRHASKPPDARKAAAAKKAKPSSKTPKKTKDNGKTSGKNPSKD